MTDTFSREGMAIEETAIAHLDSAGIMPRALRIRCRTVIRPPSFESVQPDPLTNTNI
jgi:hypothetical protein